MTLRPKSWPPDRTTYLIGRAPQLSTGDWNQPIVTYSPAKATNEEVWIGIYEGIAPHDNGCEVSPQDVLKRPGLLKIVDECGATWFLPMIRRMANGESVPLEEVASEYRRVHGADLESKHWEGANWFPSIRAAYDRALRSSSKS